MSEGSLVWDPVLKNQCEVETGQPGIMLGLSLN